MPENKVTSAPPEGAPGIIKALLLPPEGWVELEAEARPAGLLAFTYWVKFDDRYHRAFHDDPLRTVALFGIDPNSELAQDIIEVGENSGNASVVPRLAALFAKYLVNEVLVGPPRDYW